MFGHISKQKLRNLAFVSMFSTEIESAEDAIEYLHEGAHVSGLTGSEILHFGRCRKCKLEFVTQLHDLEKRIDES